ncbi:MAG: dimethyl sulfoxide reductase anchor subunit family protein [Paracoccaceae bacterium]
MHPAASVILFTALSGLGFGLLAWLGAGLPAATGRTAFMFYFIAFALSVGGLVASTFHLGNPRRALKAFSQWRSSWLSREGWSAVLALLVMAAYAIGAIFFGVRNEILGWLGATLCMATVFTTSMIYAQIKAVPRWNHPTTPLMFFCYSISGGALLAGQFAIASVLLLLCGATQFVVWHFADQRFAARASTIETATGLGRIGKVRQFEPPHTGTNYLLHEMVYVVARKHAKRLRVMALIFASILPALMLAISQSGQIIAIAAIALHITGLFIARWLFFAEAEHVVGLYYDKR